MVVIACGLNFKKDLPLTSQQSGVLGRGDVIRKALSTWRLKFFFSFLQQKHRLHIRGRYIRQDIMGRKEA